MLIGAKIMLETGADAAFEGLAGLVGHGWLMTLPGQNPYGGHPAGQGLRGAAGHARGPGLVAVVFGNLVASPDGNAVLPVQWEPIEPADDFALLLDANITLTQQGGPAGSALTLAGVCRVPPGTSPAWRSQARSRFLEATREFITYIADIITRSTAPGPAWSWVTEPPRTT